MRRLPRYASPQEIMQNRRQWADKTRLKRKPLKKCTLCGHDKPNSEQFFPMAGPRGNRISMVCRECIRVKEAEEKPNPCELCGKIGFLKVDKKATIRRVRLCHECMRRVRDFENYPQLANLIDKYLVWRQQKKGPPVGSP